MKCIHCGKEIDWNAQFCEACGGANEPITNKTKSYLLPYWQKFLNLSKRKKWLLPTVVGCILLLIVATTLLNRPKTIDFTDYITTEVTGLENSGEVYVSIDFERLTRELLGKMPDATKKKTYEKYVRYMENERRISSSLWVYTNIEGPMKNGDIFLATVKINDIEIFEELGYQIEETEQSVPIQIGKDTKKFEELVDIDLLDRITLNFTGSNGNGEAQISGDPINIDVVSSSGEEYTLTFCFVSPLWGHTSFEVYSSREEDQFAMVRVSIKDNTNLSNGDKVRVVLEHNAGTLANALKINIESIEKEFTVTGLE